MKKKILKVLEEWADLQPNMASECAREMLADDIVNVLFDEHVSRKTETYNTDELYDNVVDASLFKKDSDETK